jgi:peptide/nickel transport system substrate-binding protein
MNRRHLLASSLGLLALPTVGAHAAPPDEPLVLAAIPKIGKRGGTLRMLVQRAKDTRLFFVFGHARLVNYTPDLSLFADIVASYDVTRGRVFTLRLRRGHCWSDGHPFTTEDLRFYWEDVALDKKLRPTGPPIAMLVEGEAPRIEILDEQSIRYSWSRPNPNFLPMLAAASPEFIYMPAHYLKQFHVKFADPAKLEAMTKATSSRDWAQLFGRRERMDKFDNPDLPTLQPWMLTTPPPADRYVAVRNPHFHRVDTNGQQLPYLDRFTLEVVESKLIPIKTGAGQTDLQFRGLAFKDYTFLKESEKRSGLTTLLWREARSAHLALYPNLNAADPVWQKLFRDRRFRLALSHGLDRDAINQYLYFGLATPANNTVLEDSPFYTKAIGEAGLGYDLKKANSLLDEAGLGAPDANGLRKLADGRPMELIVETAGEDSEQSDVLELVRDSWRKIGFVIHTKPSDREVLRNRIFSGEALMTIWYGIENGVPTADWSPGAFAPTSQADQPQWPKWGQYYETKGQAGEPPADPAAKQLLELFQQWNVSETTEQRGEIWKKMLDVYAPECFTIGTVANVKQPIAMRRNMMNVPKEGLYNWDPRAQIGIYRPDTFWYADS